MFNHHGSHQRPQWPQSFNPAPLRNGPPLAKKPKSNPIITRYPPPPGYKGPLQQQNQPWSQNPAWSQPQQNFNYGQQPRFSHPPQSYEPSQPYQQPQYTAYQPNTLAQQQYPQTAYPAPGHFSQHAANSQQFPWPESAASSSPPAWHPFPQAPPQQRHFSAPSLIYKPESGQFVQTEDVTPLQPPPTDEDLEEDFDAECYFALHPEEIDPRFSLGMIEWKAALPTKRPLPSTFAEAELEALAPRKPLSSDDECISEYFIKSKRHEAYLSVRQTAYWQEIKHDIIFKDFPAVCHSHLSVPELLAKYKDRPDPTWLAREYSATPDPERGSDAYEGAMEDVNSAVADAAEQSDTLGDLDRAVRQSNMGRKRRHSRASSTTSISSHKSKRPKALAPIKDKAQEDILAALGVTGSPKLVYETPGPAIGAPQQQRNNDALRHSRHNSMASNNGAPHLSRPSSQAGQTHASHTAHGQSRRGSDTSSQYTARASDFEDNDATPRPKYTGKENRKRLHDDSGDDSERYTRGDDNDKTPKPKRKQQRIQQTHGARRW